MQHELIESRTTRNSIFMDEKVLIPNPKKMPISVLFLLLFRAKARRALPGIFHH
jgi:hypothetical protein